MTLIKKEKITLRKRGQITIPKQIVESLELSEGETLEIRVEDGKIVIVPTFAVAKDQSWFWSEAWQLKEQEANFQIKEGRVSAPMELNEAIKFLDDLKDSE